MTVHAHTNTDIMWLEFPYLVPTPNIPHSEADVFVFHGFDIESCSMKVYNLELSFSYVNDKAKKRKGKTARDTFKCLLKSMGKMCRK